MNINKLIQNRILPIIPLTALFILILYIKNSFCNYFFVYNIFFLGLIEILSNLEIYKTNLNKVLIIKNMKKMHFFINSISIFFFILYCNISLIQHFLGIYFFLIFFTTLFYFLTKINKNIGRFYSLKNSLLFSSLNFQLSYFLNDKVIQNVKHTNLFTALFAKNKVYFIVIFHFLIGRIWRSNKCEEIFDLYEELCTFIGIGCLLACTNGLLIVLQNQFLFTAPVTVLTITIFDTFSMFTGKLISYGYFFKKISPQKTLTGLIGGIVSIYILINYLFKLQISCINVIILSLCLFIGDLYESIWKRSLNIKNSSCILGNHGGILDRFDSYIGVYLFFLIKI